MRRPRRDDEAVGAVVGTVLLVAIAVTLATLAYVLATRLAGSQEHPPALGFLPNQGNGELKVVRSEEGLQASRLAVSLSRDGHVALGATASLATTAAPAGQFVALAAGAGAVEAGDLLTFCLDGGRGAATVQVRDQASNTLLYGIAFLDLPACA